MDSESNKSLETTSRMVKSTAVIGSSNALVTLIRIVRTKVFALLLGPAGIGLVGLYDSVMKTAIGIGGLGISSSAVRQVAQASGDLSRMKGTLYTLRLLTAFLGIAAALAVSLASKPLSHWIFGSYSYSTVVLILSIGVFAEIASGSQTAVLNGLRRIGDLARLNIIGTSLGTVAAIILVWFKGLSALVYACVLPVVISLACSSWMVRRLSLQIQKPDLQELRNESRMLLKLGIVFMLTGFMMPLVMLLARLILVNRLGLAAIGLFQAAWVMAVINVDFILNAMCVDFYPHLSGCVQEDARQGNRLVNEQTQVALLLGGPVILASISLSGPILGIFYSGKFALASELLRWLLLGSILKIVSWPIGFLIVAHGWTAAMFGVEFLWCSIFAALVYAGSIPFGVNSTGYAFVVAYVIYLIAVYAVTHIRVYFRWSRSNVLLTGTLLLMAITVMLVMARNQVAGYSIGSLFILSTGLFSLHRLGQLTNNAFADRVVRSLRKRFSAVERFIPLLGARSS